MRLIPTIAFKRGRLQVVVEEEEVEDSGGHSLLQTFVKGEHHTCHDTGLGWATLSCPSPLGD